MKGSEKIKILYIDDEVNNLNGFKAAFRMDYNILLAENTVIALELLEKNADIRVIVSDQRMPNQTGVQFFQSILTTFPKPIRILLTGYTDIEAVIDSINMGHIFRYIRKPWNEMDVVSALEEANKFYLAESILNSKNKELQKAYDELDKFAYSVTHDMRGPLLSILGAVDLSKNMEDINEIKYMLSMMEKSVLKLDNFIQSVHEYYNLKRGELHIVNVNFNEIIKDLLDMYEISGKLNAIKFTTTVNQQSTFRSDEMFLRIILNNLLSNSFKYYRKDIDNRFVNLIITVATHEAIICVNDNGIGIPEEHIGEIFKMFYRATNEETGSGFGLYNVSDALSKLNGNIFVDSKLNEGTRFKVVIPSK